MFDRKAEGKISLVGRSRRLEDNIKMHVKWTGFLWLSILPVVGFVEGSNRPLGFQVRQANCLTSGATVSFSKESTAHTRRFHCPDQCVTV